MAHHQGMSLLALDDLLRRDINQRRFHRDSRIRAFESLLFERVPAARPRAEGVAPRAAPVRTVATEEPAERTWKEETAVPRVHVSGNGRFTTVVTNSGGGYIRWNGFDVTRWRSDVTLDPWEVFFTFATCGRARCGAPRTGRRAGKWAHPPFPSPRIARSSGGACLVSRR